MNLEILEQALKKVWDYGYKWGRKQSNSWDYQTNFVYNVRTFSQLLEHIDPFSTDLKNYAVNRWYNYWSAMWAEYIFAAHKNVIPNKDIYDKLVDFRINGISFDHKTSVFPKWFNKSFEYAQEHKKELIEWFYKNQSQQWRKHFRNRLFIVMYDSETQQHWKMKAEISVIQKSIDSYVRSFSRSRLLKLDFWDGVVYSDIIWIIK